MLQLNVSFGKESLCLLHTQQKANQVCGKLRLTAYITNFGMLAHSEVRENKLCVVLERAI